MGVLWSHCRVQKALKLATETSVVPMVSLYRLAGDVYGRSVQMTGIVAPEEYDSWSKNRPGSRPPHSVRLWVLCQGTYHLHPCTHHRESDPDFLHWAYHLRLTVGKWPDGSERFYVSASGPSDPVPVAYVADSHLSLEPIDRTYRQNLVHSTLEHLGVPPVLVRLVLDYYGLILTCEQTAMFYSNVSLAKPESHRDTETIALAELPDLVKLRFTATLHFSFMCACRIVPYDGVPRDGLPCLQ